MMKTLWMLIGPKGSGKTTIGQLVAEHTEAVFLRVEQVWLELKPGEDGWRKVEEAIAESFAQHSIVIIESLGVGDDFEAFFARLKQRYAIRLIRVYADPDTCLQRVQARDASLQLPATLEQVRAYNRAAAAVELPWDLEIDNNGPASEAEILSSFKGLLMEFD